MIPVPKAKFFKRKIPAGQSEDDYFDEICRRQTHILGDAIDRVSFFFFELEIKQSWRVSSYVKSVNSFYSEWSALIGQGVGRVSRSR